MSESTIQTVSYMCHYYCETYTNQRWCALILECVVSEMAESERHTQLTHTHTQWFSIDTHYDGQPLDSTLGLWCKAKVHNVSLIPITITGILTNFREKKKQLRQDWKNGEDFAQKRWTELKQKEENITF